MSEVEKIAHITPQRLDELWFHTGTRCNLSCPFCLEGSGPLADRLDFMTKKDVLPLLDEAVELGVQQFSFTGGEPFFNPEFIHILGEALMRKPVMVLTNATIPLQNHLEQIKQLQGAPNSLHFRVSLDSPDPKKHDRFRGKGNFERALNSMKDLHRLGFGVSIARHRAPTEDTTAVDQQYQKIMADSGLPENLNIVSFPDFLTPFANKEVPKFTEDKLKEELTQEGRDTLMCTFSKMVIKRNGQVAITACTLVDDDPSYDRTGSLKEVMQKPVSLKHHRCYSCFMYGSSCSEMKGQK